MSFLELPMDWAEERATIGLPNKLLFAQGTPKNETETSL